MFQQRLTLLDDGQYGGETPWPLEFERAGREAKFLWLAKTRRRKRAAWDSFPGVFGYYAVKGEKPGATVYARFSDPEAGIGDKRPVYMASQFYGAGQVFYIGSGEMWRLRAVDPAYFEVLYTKLDPPREPGAASSAARRAARCSSSAIATSSAKRSCSAAACPTHSTSRSPTRASRPKSCGPTARPNRSSSPPKPNGPACTSASHGASGRHVPSCPAGARQQRRAVLEIHSGPRARLGAHPRRTKRAHCSTSIAKETGGIYYRSSIAAYGDAATLPLGQSDSQPGRSEAGQRRARQGVRQSANDTGCWA